MHARHPRLAAALVVASLIVGGCSGQPPGSVGASTAVASADVGAASSPAGSAEAEPTRFPSPPPSEPPGGPPDASPNASATPEPATPEPPAASLSVDGGDSVAGELGGFTWMNGGSDAPWVPGARLHVGRGEQLTLSLAAAVPIDTWSVARTPAATVGDGVVGMGDGSTVPITFAAPPRGSWSVSVQVWFAGNVGSAAYYWLITVD